MLLSFITLINAQTWAYELSSNFKNKSEQTLLFYGLRSKKQAQGKSYHSQTCFNNILYKNLSDWEIKFLSSYHREAQMQRSENLFYQTNLFIDTIISSIQHSINWDVTIFYCRADIFLNIFISNQP